MNRSSESDHFSESLEPVLGLNISFANRSSQRIQSDPDTYIPIPEEMDRSCLNGSVQRLFYSFIFIPIFFLILKCFEMLHRTTILDTLPDANNVTKCLKFLIYVLFKDLNIFTFLYYTFLIDYKIALDLTEYLTVFGNSSERIQQ